MAWPIKPDSKRQQIISVLTEGPSTTSEVSAETGIPFRLASAHLSNLRQLGLIVSKRHHDGHGQVTNRNLWSMDA